jgi:phosphoglucomutase
MTDYRQEYERWITESVFDEDTKRELKALTDEEEIEDRFYKALSFGTGGLRGMIGAGTNRMNVYTVGKATQGLADFINGQTTGGSVAIAYDSRNMSPEFALDSALILAANGIKAYLFESLRPTPELSFAVRYLQCTAGIVITASHNPPAYNGYKVYWSDGGQIVPPYDKGIIEKINAVADYTAIRRTSRANAEEAGLFEIIGQKVDDAYFTAIKRTVLSPDAIFSAANDIKIVYTPLHGTGNIPVRRALRDLGFTKVWVVPEQELPDGNFSTVSYPNPEDPRTFDLALKLARKKDADLVLATDPDADRLGVYVKDNTGSYVPFTGNMSGLLIAEYRLSVMEKKHLLPSERKNGAIVSTIVSSDMAKAMAAAYGLTHIEVLTGFKYIGEQIKLFEEAKKQNGGRTDYKKYAYEYLFGFEESYGCLVGTYARDKDAVAAVTALCEAAAYYKREGLNLCEQMERIYQKYGYYHEELYSMTLEGVSGGEKIAKIMQKLRSDVPATIGGLNVKAVRDYAIGDRTDRETGERSPLNLPESNVLYFELDGGWCCARPSGTEPKIKFYFGVKGESKEDAAEKVRLIKEDLLTLGEEETDEAEE